MVGVFWISFISFIILSFVIYSIFSKGEEYVEDNDYIITHKRKNREKPKSKIRKVESVPKSDLKIDVDIPKKKNGIKKKIDKSMDIEKNKSPKKKEIQIEDIPLIMKELESTDNIEISDHHPVETMKTSPTEESEDISKVNIESENTPEEYIKDKDIPKEVIWDDITTEVDESPKKEKSPENPPKSNRGGLGLMN